MTILFFLGGLVLFGSPALGVCMAIIYLTTD